MGIAGLDRETRGYALVAGYSSLLNVALVGAKYWLGNVSGSQALKADAIHSMADLVTSLSVLLGIVIAGRKTRTFPHGLYKVENLVALFCSFFIFFAAYEIAKESLFGSPAEQLQHVSWVVVGIGAIMGAVYLFSRYELAVGLEARSPTLIADAKQLTSDMLSYVVILFGIVATHFGYRIDRYVAIFVAALVARIGFEILVDSLKVLLEATLDYRTLDGIKQILTSTRGVRDVRDISGRNSGRFTFVEVALTTDLKLLRRAHALTEELEREIQEKFPNIDRILIHYEPERKESWLIAVPATADAGARMDENTRIAEHFGGAEFFAILSQDTRTGAVRLEDLRENPNCRLERKKGMKTAAMLQEWDIDQVYTHSRMEGLGPAYALEGMGIETFVTGADTVGELAVELRHNFDSGSESATNHAEPQDEIGA